MTNAPAQALGAEPQERNSHSSEHMVLRSPHSSGTRYSSYTCVGRPANRDLRLLRTQRNSNQRSLA
jgi:hypothetical protein